MEFKIDPLIKEVEKVELKVNLAATSSDHDNHKNIKMENEQSAGGEI